MPTKRRRKMPVALIIILVVVLVAALAGAVYVWNRGYRYDDASDIQGSWKDAASGVIITIDDDTIHMTDTLGYGYELDSWNKVISYSFEDASGEGTYRFSDDRYVLVIDEEVTESDATTEDVAMVLLRVDSTGNVLTDAETQAEYEELLDGDPADTGETGDSLGPSGL